MACSSQILEKFSIILGQVYLVCLYFLWIVAKPLLVGIDLENQISSLIVGILAEIIYVCKAVHHADANFCTILCLTTGFTSYYRTHMGLEDAHNSVKT